MFLQGHKFNLFVLFLMNTTLLPMSASGASTQKQALGELKIEGKHIERLVLCRNSGLTEQFNEPNEVIKLAVGKYRLQEVRLKGGLTCNSLYNLTNDWLIITENETVVLKIGAPLRQTVKIERQGPILKLNYNLTGVGGENYASTKSAQPSFTIFKGNKKVAAGKFEFG